MKTQPQHNKDPMHIHKSLSGMAAALAATLLCLNTASAGQQTYDAQTEFIAGSNPSGAWSYGWYGTVGGAFTPFASSGTVALGGVNMNWWRPTPSTSPVLLS